MNQDNRAAASHPHSSTNNAEEAETPPVTPRISAEAETPRPEAERQGSSVSSSSEPPSKRLKMTPAKTPRPGLSDHAEPPVTPRVSQGDTSEPGQAELVYRVSQAQEMSEWSQDDENLPKTPLPSVDRRRSVSSSPSDLSSSSRRELSASPSTPFVPEVPPAPPSTPASDFRSTLSSSRLLEGMATPLPYATAVRNAAQLERQQMLSDGAATPAPTKPASNRTEHDHRGKTSLIDDFSDWAVGERYKMVRMLGRGSYGEVAQALDLHRGNLSVAIKRIQSPFEQEVDAVRLYREIHILRQLKGHECVVDLLDVIRPPSDELEDFHDLYLVFECKCHVTLYSA